jgi:uncharacterized membrane protein YGL010W
MRPFSPGGGCIIAPRRSAVGRVDALFADYASYHRTRGNLVCHAFGIPLIIFGIVWMLRAASLPGIPRGSRSRSRRERERALRVGLGAFALGWVFQGVGHAYFEKNKPAFFKNLAHVLIGPLFLVKKLLRVG